MDDQMLAYKQIPENRLQAKVLSNVSPTDMWVTLFTVLVMVASGVWAFRLSGSTLLMILVVLSESIIYIVLMYRMRDGFYRFYGEIYHAVVMQTKHAVFGGVWWKADDTDRWLKRWLRTRNGHRPPFPFNFTVIKAVIEGKVERVAILRELDRPYDHVYFTAEGGSFVTHDPSMQMRLVDDLASITNRAVSMANLKLGITYLRIVSPFDKVGMTSFFGSNIDPRIVNPQQFALNDQDLSYVERQQQTMHELIAATGSHGAARTIAVVKLTIKRDRKFWRRARGGKFSNEELYDLPVIELSREMASSLANNSLFEFEDVKVLGLADLADLQRCALDVVDIRQYYEDRRTGVIPRTDDEIDAIVDNEGVTGLNQRLQCWPREQIVIGPQGKWMKIDNTYFSVLRVKEMRKSARADEFLNIHYSAPAGVWTRVATVGQSVAGSTETRTSMVRTSALLNLHDARYSKRVVDDPRRRRKRDQANAQLEEVSNHSIAQYFNILFVVAASSERDVLRQRRSLKASLLDIKFVTHEVDDVAHIQNAVLSGVLGINRL